MLEKNWDFLGGSNGKEFALNSGDPNSLSRKDFLEEGMATHSSILAWRIPRGASKSTVHRVAKSLTRLSD